MGGGHHSIFPTTDLQVRKRLDVGRCGGLGKGLWERIINGERRVGPRLDQASGRGDQFVTYLGDRLGLDVLYKMAL